jgi:hypothetical protein
MGLANQIVKCCRARGESKTVTTKRHFQVLFFYNELVYITTMACRNKPTIRYSPYVQKLIVEHKYITLLRPQVGPIPYGRINSDNLLYGISGQGWQPANLLSLVENLINEFTSCYQGPVVINLQSKTQTQNLSRKQLKKAKKPFDGDFYFLQNGRALGK